MDYDLYKFGGNPGMGYPKLRSNIPLGEFMGRDDLEWARANPNPFSKEPIRLPEEWKNPPAQFGEFGDGTLPATTAPTDIMNWISSNWIYLLAAAVLIYLLLAEKKGK